MVEKILPNMYRIEIPLPGSPLKALNFYLIRGEERFLLIDTGWNREECKREMLSELERLDVDLNKTDFFITHTYTSVVYFNHKEASMINAQSSKREERNQKFDDTYISNGFPENELKKSVESHPGRRYGLRHQSDFRILKEGDKIEMGDYSFRCIETTGHSPSHMCLYEANRKILGGGDHILVDITPNNAF